MSGNRAKLSDQIRAAVEDSEMSRYAICKLTGIDQASFSRFMRGQVGLCLDNLDRLADVLGLRLIISRPKRPKTGRKGKT